MFGSSMGNEFARRSRGAESCSVALMIVSVAVLMMFIGRIRVQAHSVPNDDEIEDYLNRINKPAVKSFTINGDIVDCIDIYKQPALDHPLLKDHNIITEPSFFPTTKIDNGSNFPLALEAILGNGEECPQGTVAIRRVQRSDLAHAKSLDGYGRREDIPAWQMAERAGAAVDTEDVGYVGAAAYLNLWKVQELDIDSWSHAVLEISDRVRAFIEAGWLVNPYLYSDLKTRLYTYWTNNEYKSGCYNLVCPGFVQTSRKVPLGMPFSNLSVYDGNQHEIRITLYQEGNKRENLKWWLMLQDELVGYFPVSIFTYSSLVKALSVKTMGAVLNTYRNQQHTVTDMGSGHFASEGWAKAAYIRDVQVMVESDKGFYHPGLQAFADNSSCYTSFIGVDSYSLTTVYYGGPGLGAQNC